MRSVNAEVFYEADDDADGICDDVDDCVGDYDECGICNGPGDIYECGCSDIQKAILRLRWKRLGRMRGLRCGDGMPEDACNCNGNQLDALGECGGVLRLPTMMLMASATT